MCKEKSMPLISIIIPVYNVEKYLERCVNSVLNQTIHDIEVVLIDDGSTDCSGEICDRFALSDERIKVFHIKNSGVSAARNIGMSMITGKYVGFVDSDDFIENNMYEFLYNNMKKHSAEISVCAVNDIYVGYNRVPKYLKKVLNKETAFFEEYSYGGCITCNKLFIRDMIHDLRYLEGIANGEDRLFLFEAMSRSKLVVYDLLPMYNYFHRSDSAGTGSFKIADYGLIEICKKIIDILSLNAPNALALGEKQLWNAHRFLVEKILLFDNETQYERELKILCKDIRKNLVGILFNKCIGYKSKIAFILLSIDSRIYKYCVKKFRKNEFLHS